MKVGLILECQSGAPEEQVLRHLIERLKPDADVSVQAMGNKPTLVTDCGETAGALFEIENCDKVFVIWDLWPAWEQSDPCMKEDRDAIADSLTASDVAREKTHLICIIQELEAWLIADGGAVTRAINDLRRNHPEIPRIADENSPEQVQRPKQRLMRLFRTEGKVRSYNDWLDAIRIARNFPNFHKLERAPAFVRFQNYLNE
jgi:hypothetical protein